MPVKIYETQERALQSIEEFCDLFSPFIGNVLKHCQKSDPPTLHVQSDTGNITSDALQYDGSYIPPAMTAARYRDGVCWPGRFP